jgi:arylsulfatase A-like enzyme
MKKSVPDILRKIAQMIVIDETPSEEQLARRRQRCERDPEGVLLEAPVGEKVPGVPSPRVQEEKVEYIAPPQQRLPRRQPEHHKKWNKEDSKGLMKEYMQDYRAQGNDVGNRYVKKPRI